MPTIRDDRRDLDQDTPLRRQIDRARALSVATSADERAAIRIEARADHANIRSRRTR